MKDLGKDSVWQKMLDEDKVPPTEHAEAGLQAYQFLYNVLKQEPEARLSEGFAERVAQQALRQQTAKSGQYWLLSLILMVVAILICGSILFYAYPSFFQLLRSQLNILGFAGLMFIVIQAADYWLIQRKRDYQLE